MPAEVNQDLIVALATIAAGDDPLISPEIALDVLQGVNNELDDVSATFDHHFAAELLRRVPEHALLKAIAQHLELGFHDFTDTSAEYSVATDLLRAPVDPAVLSEHVAIPLRSRAGQVAVAMRHPEQDTEALRHIQDATGVKPIPLLASGRQIQQQLLRNGSGELVPERGPAQVGDWVESLLIRAVSEGASDVYFDSVRENEILVRTRVDDRMDVYEIPLGLQDQQDAIVRVLLQRASTMDATKVQRIQDGSFRMSMPIDGRTIDLRVALIPQEFGPGVTLRILDPNNIRRSLEESNHRAHTLQAIRAGFKRKQGLIAFSGGTGSGKTTTMVQHILELDPIDNKICTVEDPIEYRLPNVGQISVRHDAGENNLSMGDAATALVRHKPDVIMIGEIRDAATAAAAITLSRTGHLVVSSIHANSALEIATRLGDLGVHHTAVLDTLNLGIAQRLLPQLHTCKVVGAPNAEEKATFEMLGLEVPETVAREGRCAPCSDSGIKGRLPVSEVLRPTRQLRAMIASRASVDELRAATRDEGHRSLLMETYDRVLAHEVPVRALNSATDEGAL